MGMRRKRAVSHPLGVPVIPEQPQPQPDGWKTRRVTVGLLVALALGVAVLVGGALSFADKARAEMLRHVSTHNASETAHRGTRAAIEALGRRMDKRLDRIERRLDKALEGKR